MAISTVEAYINGTWHTLTYNGTSGKYEKTITAPTGSSFNLAGGHYPCQVRATDVAGNVTLKDDTDGTLGTSLQLVVKEKVAPTVTITSPGASAKLTTATPSITFQLRDADSGVKISTLALKINGGTTFTNASTGMTCNAVAGGYDCTYVPQTAIPDGTANTVTINVSDNDGNAATQASVTFTVDTVAPTLNVTSPTAGLITNTAAQTVAGTTSDITTGPCTIAITVNGVDQGAITVTSGNFSKGITLAAGSNTIVVTATDGAGKTSQVSRTVTLDTTPPTITSVTITPNPVDAGATFVIAVAASDV